ncbi:MAG: gliding motility-associated C-terminal domain-containing protein [Bacteroidetes bacterium]|nr:gliding motility-associated C-terminal domain-containing protein [Bacteroidota bacterium]
MSFFSKSQTLYWVGGSGNINDGHHWSYTSGGTAVGVSPSPSTDLVFDDNSSSNGLVIDITGLIHIKSVKFNQTKSDYYFRGSDLSTLNCGGDFILNEKTFFEANTKLVFTNSSSENHTVNFCKNSVKADVLFEQGNWDLQSVKVADNYLLKINKGNYTLNNTSIIAGNLEAISDKVVFKTIHSVLYIKNRIVLEDNVSFKSNDLIVIAQKNNPALYRVNSLVDLGLQPKIFNTNPNPQACTITYSFTNPSCAGSCDASITIGFDPSCTTGPYDMLFNNSSGCFPSGANGINSSTYSLNSICSCNGQLDIFVFDAGGFVTQLNGLPTPQAPTSVGLIFSGLKQPRCFGDCDGALNIFPSGGSPPYNISVIAALSGSTVATYTNIPAVTTTSVSGLCAGTYSFLVADSKNCSKTFTTTMTQPALINPHGASTDVTCNGACNGSATVAPTGGVGPYSYSWLSASSTPSTSTTATIANLCPGIVTMTVTDSKTCTAVYNANITQPPAITLTVTKTDLNCGSICNGTASVTATGGLGAFSYSWAPSGGSGASASGLCAGNYTCTVTNNGNCVKTITVAILSPPTLTASPTQSNILCNAVCNGSVNLHPSGGTPNFTYNWTPAVSSGSIATNLCAGAYVYTITDFLGCQFTNTVTITQPPALTLTIASTSITCNGACDGTAAGNPGGGAGSYTYSWSPGNPSGQSTAAITNLCPGTFTLKVTDANLCNITNTVSITQPIPITTNATSVIPTCNGLCNGSINSNPSGGTTPYTFTLQSSSGSLTSNPPYTNLCAGSYTLIVKDSRGCIKNQVINLTQPNPIILTLNTTPINCFNQCNATISTVVNGGTPLYTFTWSAGGTGSSLTNQCVGVHTATVTDANGCKGIGTATVTAPPDLTVSITPTNPNCNAQCTGIATASVSGGTPNYAINWNNGNTGNIISGLCQGTYTATVTDFFGCTKIQTVAIVTPPAITLTATNATVSCAGSCDGIVTVTPTGGTPGYFYSWNSVPAQTTATASGLCVGNYVANVTDSKGCIASVAANVSQPAVLTASISNVQPSCNVCIGSATANGIGGTAPYTYSWSPGGQTTPTANNLCVGVQTVIVTDAKGCTSTQTVQINQTVIILATTNGSTLTCNGVCSGIATANPSGGIGPYNYTWTPSVQNTQTAINLCAGTHTVVVSDANGCSNTSTVNFVNPPAITLTVNQTNVTCNGLCNGIASANASGGTGAISYKWQPGGATTSSINGLCPGDYTVTATDANNCSQTQIVTITQANSLTASFTFTNPTTCTSSNGAINATISGGTPTYTLSWLPGGSSANPLTNLSAGTYSLNVIDAAGCNQTIITTLNNPTGPTVTVTSNSISCFGSCTGSATLTISGSGPFNVNWPAPVSSTNTVVTGLCAGLFIPVVTDVNNCITNQTVNIAQPTQLTSSGLVTNATCNSACTASINLSPSGGIPSYSYTWSPSGGSGQDPVNLCAGSYSVDIADANGCLITNTFVVTQPATLTLNFNKKDVLCNGNCTGGVRAIVGGGTGPYTYTWTPFGSFAGANIDTLVNLCSGDYTVTVMDANGCSISGIVTIGQPAVFTSTITSVNMKCNGQCNGSAIINASGGTAPYTYNYNTTPITPTQTIGGLCVGTYTGSAIDANGCVSSNNFNITEPLPIIVTTTISNPKCNAVCNGSVATTVTGGNPNYSYNWIPNGGPVPNPTGLCAGNYTVIVTDDSLCTGQALVVLTDPAALIANISFTNPTCNSGCNGIVTANPIGGTAPFSYLWQTPLNLNQTVTNLCAGSYTLTLTDANLCQNVQVVTLLDPPAISLNPAITPATCGFNDGSINATASSGVAPYTYNWLPPVPGAQATNSLVTSLGAGVYTVIVTDAASCSATISIPLSNSNGPSGATITSTNVTCHGLCNGTADVSNPVGGTSPYTLSWVNPVSAATTITNLCAGSYTAQIEDANNCLFFQSVTISEPQLIDDNEIITSAACSGNCNGSISVNPTGGNGTYTYAWSNSATTQTVNGLCPGLISIVITDNLNCTYATTYTVPSITTITSSTFATNNTCFGNCNGTLLATNVAGGLPPYSYAWNDPIGQASASAIGLCNGTYSVTITDANGCFNTLPAAVTSPAQITFTPTITEPSCDLCNGSAIINPIGGTPGYTYLWSVNNQTGNTATNLCAGVYMVQITDGNGCQSNSNVIINSSSSITGETVTFADVSCGGTCDGTVSVTAIGGTGPITYHWVHNGSSSQTLNGLCAGTYFCNMTDINGCSRTASVVIGAATAFTITPQVTQSSCTSSTGSITVNVSGGTGTYTYAWLPAGNTATVTNLAPGIYTLTVSDGNCSQTQVYAINSINGPLITSTKKDISCNGICDGKISLTISAGTPGYTPLWSNGATAPVVSGLCAGVYSVMVTDAAGCQAVANFSLNTISPVVFSTPDLDNPTCTNNCNGSLTTIPIGGTLPYTYSWTPTEPSTPTINGLCSGAYSVTVSDANGCPVSESYSLTNPPTLTMTAAITDASCNTVSDGAIDITVSGGVSPYTYTWTPGSFNTEDISNLSIGNYTINLTDNFGCTIDSSFRINSILTVNAVAGNDTLFCQNGTLQLNGSNSSGGINYQWLELPSNTVVSNTLITTVNPATGTSTYVLVASNGACIDRDSVTVTSLALPNVDAGPMVSIPLLSSATIGGNPTGPTGSTYSWTPVTSLDNPAGSNPTSGTTVTTVYTVTVVDGNGCSNWDTVTVLVYPEITIPNGFSPNADGKNDVWQIDFIYQFPDCEVEVYNRWGERLFYSKGYAVPFNGQYKGKDLPVGTYYYIINLNHPAYPNAYTSPLTIFR